MILLRFLMIVSSFSGDRVKFVGNVTSGTTVQPTLRYIILQF